MDDEKVVLDSLWDQIMPVLGDEFAVDLCQSGEEALQLADEYIAAGDHLAVIISDMLMPGMKGDELLIHIHERLPKTLKILLTGQTSFEAVKNAINKARLYRYISKPWEEADFVMTVTEAARSYQQYLQLIEHNRLLRSLNKATQEISGLMDAEALTDRLLTYVLENTGADACYLLAEHEAQWRVASYATPEHGATPPLNALVQAQVLERFDRFRGQDTAAHNIVTPIGKNGSQRGWLLLENNASAHPFNQHHREVVQMLASQAAISLHNAHLMGSLERRTGELEAEKVKVGRVMRELVNKNVEIEEANRLVEQKNQDILDSIHYAKRIQESILPQTEMLQKIVPQSFVFYRPKDIVSGDFYWWSVQKNRIVIAVCDCTGHGVPGAFMSMMGVNLLNQIVNEYQVFEPQVILNYLHIQMIQALNKHQNAASNDGMDCAVLAYEPDAGLAWFGGARRPLYLVRNGELIQHEATRRSIADMSEHRTQDFTAQEIALQPGDRMYLFTDGIVDQFGSESFRKFSPRRLRELLLHIAAKPMDEQPQHLGDALDDWQLDHKQTDDILVIGLGYEGRPC